MPTSFALQANARLYGNYQFAGGHTWDRLQVQVGSRVHRTRKEREQALQAARKVTAASVGAAGHLEPPKPLPAATSTPPQLPLSRALPAPWLTLREREHLLRSSQVHVKDICRSAPTHLGPGEPARVRGARGNPASPATCGGNQPDRLIDKGGQRARTFREETFPCLLPTGEISSPEARWGLRRRRPRLSLHIPFPLCTDQGMAWLWPCVPNTRQSRCVNTARWEV